MRKIIVCHKNQLMVRDSSLNWYCLKLATAVLTQLYVSSIFSV